MDFWIDIATAVMLRALKDRRELKRLRPIFIKVATAILVAFGDDHTFMAELNSKVDEARTK